MTIMLLAALIVRCYDLDRLPLWYDEVIHFEWCRTLPFGLFAGKTEIVEPFFCVLLYLLQLVDTADWWVRLHSVVAGTLTVVVGYKLALRAAGRLAALFTFVLLSAAPFLVYYSRDAKEYALLALIEIGAIYTALAYRTSPHRNHYLVAYVALATGAVYTHILSPLWLVALNLTWFVVGPRWSRVARRWYAAQVVVIVLSVPFLLAELRFVTNMDAKFFWAPRPTLYGVLTTIENFVVGYAVDNWVRWLGVAIAAVGAIRAVIGDSQRRQAVLLLLGTAMGQLALLAFASALGRNSYYVDRFMIGSSVALIVVLGMGIAAFQRPALRRVLGMALIIPMAFTLYRAFANDLDPDWLKHVGVYRTFDTRSMARAIAAAAKHSEPVWHLDHHILAPLRWYAPDHRHIRVDMGGRLRMAEEYRAAASAENIASPYEEVEDAAKKGYKIWIAMPGSPDTLQAGTKGILAWARARATDESIVSFGGSNSIFPESTLYCLTMQATANPVQIAREETVITASVPKDAETTKEPARLRFRATPLLLAKNENAVANALMHARNDSLYPQTFEFDALPDADVMYAAEFDRTQAGFSKWILQAFRDRLAFRTAMVITISGERHENDTLVRRARLSKARYRVYIERIVSGSNYIGPVADIMLRIGEHSLTAPHTVSGDDEGGWNWVDAGALEWDSDADAVLQISAVDTQDRPEARAAFSRLLFVRDGEGVQIGAPLRTKVSLKPEEERAIPISRAFRKSLHIQVVNSSSSDALILYSHPLAADVYGR
ncbi:MAG: glycosyltransferase family 39 protein [Candidatus Hydrogenedentes bacterium]|nr:glycosyltransferase family 39 protein [Candidatus Hydrogenedentota bacterium]